MTLLSPSTESQPISPSRQLLGLSAVLLAVWLQFSASFHYNWKCAHLIGKSIFLDIRPNWGRKPPPYSSISLLSRGVFDQVLGGSKILSNLLRIFKKIRAPSARARQKMSIFHRFILISPCKNTIFTFFFARRRRARKFWSMSYLKSPEISQILSHGIS